MEQRSKETSEDYRYFPEPDLPPLRISRAWVDEIRTALPELPDVKRDRFVAQYGLTPGDAAVLAADPDVADYFEAAAIAGQKAGIAPQTTANWMAVELFRLLKVEGAEIDHVPIRPAALAELIALVEEGTITASSGKAVFREMSATGRSAAEIVEEKGLAQISDQKALAQIVEQIISANPEQVALYQGGKETLLQWFIGQVMRATRGKANPQVVRTLLQEKLHA